VLDGGTIQGTLTVLFTDVEGSTAFRTRAGDPAGNRVMADHDRLVLEQVARHEGRHVKSLGDGCLAVFTSPRRAVECAVAVQRAAISSPLRVRIGLNAGEVTLTDEDVFGAAVNAAARIAAKALGGEILVSDVVRQLMGSRSGVELRDRGRVRLRGFPERWRLYEVLWETRPVPGAAAEPGPFVGRAAELARLQRVFENLPGGHGAVVVIRGEAGIGKTRLATEALTHAHARGWRVLAGRASPFGGGLGLEPIVEAFGGLLRSLDGPAVEGLVADLPHLARLFEGIGLVPAPPLGDLAMERTLLFESVARLLERVAAQTPAVLLIDDIQWADPASLELLHQLARGIGRQSIALVLTYRPQERDESERLRQLLVSLRRLGLVEEVELDRLPPSAVEGMAREFLGGRVPSRLLEVLVRAGGTPLFIEAFLRWLVDYGQLQRVGDGWALVDDFVEVPTAVRDLLLERLDGLDDVARRVVDLVALTGSELSYEVLTATDEFGPEILAAALERLAATGLLVEEVEPGDLAYRLSHPLYYEVAAGAQPVISQRRGHTILAAALERARPDDIEGLARHYLGAGSALDPPRALEVLAGAGDCAARRRAYAEAVRFLDAAVGLARRVDRIERLPTLLEGLAEARHGAGQFDAAVASWTEALDLRQPAGEARAIASVRRALGLAEFDRGHLVEARDHLDAAVALLDGAGASPELADLHVARVTLLRRLGQPEELLGVADQLEELAAALGSARVRAQAAYARGAALVDTAHPVPALQHGIQGVLWAGEAGDDAVAYRLHTVCGDACMALGDHAGLLDHSLRARGLVRTLGVGTLAGGAALYRILAALQSGAWDEGLIYSDEDVEVAQRLDSDRLTASVLGLRAWLLALRGDLVEAEELVAHLKERFGGAIHAERRGFATVAQAEARLALEQGQPDRALASMRHLDETAAIPYLTVMPLAEGRARAGDFAGARRAAAALKAWNSPFMAAEAAYVEGLLHLAESAADLAAERFAKSAAGFDQLGTPFEAARSRLEWSTVLTGLDPNSAAEEAERALGAFEQMGAKRYAERTRAVLVTLGARPATVRRNPSRRLGPLSPREVEVAQLVAEGFTNAEIAERLTVSVRTVTSHLDHIYTRLGIGTRAALARHMATQPVTSPVKS
jgi:class 3 adenylate cyclase/DNA-binding CsgD family transcriptional regulator